jgi:predicted nucleic acid-binding protein
MNKLVLDTNILIYAKDEDSKFHSLVMDLIMSDEFGFNSLWFRV